MPRRGRPVVMGLVELIGVCALATGSAIALVYWSAVLFHVVRTIVRFPTARAGLSLPIAGDDGRPPRLCVLVPAHNEEGCIGDIARSLARQDYPGLTCVFVLDRCTDGTRAALEAAWAEVVGDERPSLEIIELSSCPPGWVGKSHALWTGATNSAGAKRADLLLFVDADTTLDPGLARASVALMRDRNVGLLSLMSELTHDHWFEKLVQPAATMELLRQYPIARANGRAGEPRRRAFANGQFILIASDAYKKIGGHEAIRECVLEDVEIARRCEHHGVGAALLLSGGMLRCRMYDTYESFTRGWRRIFGESANRKPSRLRRNAWRVRWTATILPTMAAAGAAIGLWRVVGHGPRHDAAVPAMVLGALGLLAYFAALVLVYVNGRTPLWAVLGFPVGSWMVGGIARDAAADLEEGRPTEWGGRVYLREGRG